MIFSLITLFAVACGEDSPGDGQRDSGSTVEDASADAADAGTDGSGTDDGGADDGGADDGGADDGGADDGGSDDGGADDGGSDACVPQTCETLGAQCGSIDDGCGTQLDCGTCGTGQACGTGDDANTCVCEPKTCADLGAQCGTIDDGCGTQLDCGTCGAGQACGTGANANTCVCEPKTCADLGAECGTIDDGCGTQLDCGTCGSGQACGSGADANMCVCQPETDADLCAAASATCGSFTTTDRCGTQRTVSCGTCSGGQTCDSTNQCTSTCTPLTCNDAAAQCGLQADGCGGEIVCAAGCDGVIALGAKHSCLAKATGGIQCWGKNADGQLGTGDFNDVKVPTDVSGVSAVATDLVAGELHTCANVGGTVMCWGDQDYKAIGDFSSDQNTPQAISGLGSGGIDDLGVGSFNTCAITSAGDLYCWGDNSFSQLHGASASKVWPPALAQLGAGAGNLLSVDNGPVTSCYLDDLGQIFCSGDGIVGGLGDGSWGYGVTGTKVANGAGETAVQLAYGGYYGNGSGVGHSIGSLGCEVMSTGAAKCWGYNNYGQLGNGKNTTSNTPVQVMGLTSGVSQITAGGEHACALLDTGAVKCWGYNSHGQLGDGTTTNSNTPVTVTGLNGSAEFIIAGGYHTCAVLESGEMQCWGRNTTGQLGDATTTDSSTPVTVVP